MFAACSGNEDVLTQDITDPVDETNATREELMGDVPIEFAGVDVGMKMDVEVEEGTRGVTATEIPETQQLGVFCLAYKKLDDALGISYLNWETGATYKALTRWQENAKAHVQLNSENKGLLCWDERDTPCYYPKSNKFAYEFVAYQPYTEAVEYQKSTITAWIPLDGDDDIMYAVSDKPRGVGELAANAYGSLFFDDVKTNMGVITLDQKPYFRFRHLLSKLVFNVKLKAGASTSGHTFRVDRISLRNVGNIGRLTLATKDTNGSSIENGAFSCFYDVNGSKVPEAVRPYLISKGAEGRGTFWLREQDGTSISDLKDGDDYKYVLTTDPKTIGYGIFIPTSAGALKMDIVLCDENGKRTTSEEAIPISIPTGGWQAGSYYNINVSITPPKYFMDETRGQVDNWEAGVEVTNGDIEVAF